MCKMYVFRDLIITTTELSTLYCDAKYILSDLISGGLAEGAGFGWLDGLVTGYGWLQGHLLWAGGLPSAQGPQRGVTGLGADRGRPWHVQHRRRDTESSYVLEANIIWISIWHKYVSLGRSDKYNSLKTESRCQFRRHWLHHWRQRWRHYSSRFSVFHSKILKKNRPVA